jgi:hypothetical protein
MIRHILIFAAALTLSNFAAAQTPETRAYEAAVRAFEDGVFELAE